MLPEFSNDLIQLGERSAIDLLRHDLLYICLYLYFIDIIYLLHNNTIWNGSTKTTNNLNSIFTYK